MSKYDAILDEVTRTRRRQAARLCGVLVAVVACAHWTGLLDYQRLRAGVPDFFSLMMEATPPDFREIGKWMGPVLQTLAMSVAGTALAVSLSLPLAFLAARNTSPHPIVLRFSRGLLNLLRAVPELILGILFVAAVGFGALPGALALGIHSTGMVGKFFAEAVERADELPVEAIRATGASSMQVILHGYLPQVVGTMIDTTLYRWEYNFRASTVLGTVGAGGIGFQLIASLRILQYREVLAIILVILAMVTLVDSVGNRLRLAYR